MSQTPYRPADTTEIAPPGGTQPVAVYTASKTGLYSSDGKGSFKQVRDGLEWLNPCPQEKPK